MNKKSCLTLLLFLLIALFIIFPKVCLLGAQDGLLLWFNKILPSLLPFIIVINLLIPLNGLESLMPLANKLTYRLWHLPSYSLFAFLMGLIGSYPMGAKTVKVLYEEGKLNADDAELSLCFCNNCGPLFIIATVGGTMFNCITLGYFLLFIHLLSSLLLSLFITREHHATYCSSSPLNPTSLPTPSFTSILNKSVANAMETILCVGGYIILFSVILALLTNPPILSLLTPYVFKSSQSFIWLKGFLAGLLELSNGCYHLSQLQPPSDFSLACISAAISFGGLCVYFQTLYVIDNALATLCYLPAKFCQSLISFGLTLLFYPFYLMYTTKTHIVLNSSNLLLAFLLLLGCYLFLPTFFNTYSLSKKNTAFHKKEKSFSS